MSFSRHGIQHDWKGTISGIHVHVSAGSAETLVRGSGITNHLLIAYSLSNISAKNYKNRLMCIEVTVCYMYVSVVVLRQCRSIFPTMWAKISPRKILGVIRHFQASWAAEPMVCVLFTFVLHLLALVNCCHLPRRLCGNHFVLYFVGRWKLSVL